MTHEQILNDLFAQWSKHGTITYQDMQDAHEQMVLMKQDRRFEIVDTTTEIRDKPERISWIKKFLSWF